MPRVHTHVANRGAKLMKYCSKPGGCTADGTGEIRPGDRYHSWSFRYGGTYYQHADCGYPRPSQLTQSKMASVYAASEAAEDELASLSDADATETDGASILETVAAAARETAEEYRAAGEAMGSAGEQMESNADELESWADELDSWGHPSGDFEEPDANDEDAPTLDDAQAEWAGEFRDSINELLGNCPSF